MANNFSRRRMMQTAGLAAFAPAALSAPDNSWPPALGPGTPKICLGAPQNADEAAMRRYKQIGVDYVLMGGPRALGTKPACARSWIAISRRASRSST